MTQSDGLIGLCWYDECDRFFVGADYDAITRHYLEEHAMRLGDVRLAGADLEDVVVYDEALGRTQIKELAGEREGGINGTYTDTEAGCAVSVQEHGGWVFLEWEDPSAPPETDGPFDGVDEYAMPGDDFYEQTGDRFKPREGRR